MRLAAFNELCHREYANDRGIVTRLTLNPAEYTELAADVLSEGVRVTDPGDSPDGRAGARLTEIINPATTGGPGHSIPVSVGFVTMTPDYGDFSGTAHVSRWVQIAS